MTTRKLKPRNLSVVYQSLASILDSFFCYLSLFFIKQSRGGERSERVVAIVLSWKRIANIPNVIKGLKKQTYIDDIIIFHNHPSWLWVPGCKNIFSDKNLGSIARHEIAAGFKEYDYFVFSDDDLMLTCDFADEVLPAIRAKGKESVLGFFGRNLNFTEADKMYTLSQFVISNTELIPVDIIIGRFHIISKDGVAALANSFLNTEILRSEDDIRASMTLQCRFNKPSFVMPVKHKIKELPAPFALKHRQNHNDYRNKAVLEAVELGWIALRPVNVKQ